MTVFKKDLIDKYAKANDLTDKEAKALFQSALDIITTELLAGNDVKVNNFFNFFVKDRKEKKAINPVTLLPMVIPAVKTIHVRMSKSIKEAVQTL